MADFANGGVSLGPKIRHFRGFTVCNDIVPKLSKNRIASKLRINPYSVTLSFLN